MHLKIYYSDFSVFIRNAMSRLFSIIILLAIITSSFTNVATVRAGNESAESYSPQENINTQGVQSIMNSGTFSEHSGGANALSVSESSISVTGPHRADGTENAMITVTVRDETGQPVEGTKVVVNVLGEGTILQGPEALTASDGTTTATLTSTAPGIKSITAFIVESGSTKRISQTAVTVFTGSSVSGTLFLDANENAIQDIGEDGISGLAVQLLDSNNVELATAYSNKDGQYFFDGLAAGDYQIFIEPQLGYELVGLSTLSVKVESFSHIGNQDFQLVQRAMVQGTVWIDTNQDGLIGETETRMPGITVQATGASINDETVITDELGRYSFLLPSVAPSGPDNFNFNAGGFAINNPVSARVNNGTFEQALPSANLDASPSNFQFDEMGFSLPTENAPTNFSFDQLGYGLSTDDSPANFSFNRGSYALPITSYPGNYNFESGTLFPWTSTGSAVGVAYDGSSSNYYAHISYCANCTLTSPVFEVSSEAQSISWRWKTRYNTESYVDIVDASSGAVLRRVVNNSGTSEVWRYYQTDISAFRGQSIRLRFSNSNYGGNYIHVDDAGIQGVAVPDWDVSGNTFGSNGSLFGVSGGSYDGSNLAYLNYCANCTLTSPVFEVSSEAQSISWRWKTRYNTESYVDIVDASSGAVLRRVVNNSGTSEVWRYYQTDISAFRGQSIRLRFSNSNYGGNYIHVDDAGIQGVAVPDWDVSGNTFGSNGSLFGVSGGSYDGSNLAYLNYCANCTLTSPVFEVSSEAQSISWRWKTRYNTESYVDIVDASSGAVLRRVVNNSGTSEVWRYYQTDISAFRGQSIRLRFSNSNYGGNYIHVDDAGIQGVAVPDWDVSGNTFGSNGSLFGVSGGSYDGSNLAYLNYCANCTLTSPVFEVSSEAQSISWRWKTRYNTESYVDIVDASSGAVLRRVVNNSGTSEVWRYYQTDISAFRGQSIRLRFSNSNYGGNYIHVDDAGIQGVAVPDWDVSGNTFGSNGSLFGVSGGSYDGSNLAYLNYCANCTLTSPVFEVSSEAQSISWRWKTRYNTESYVDIVDASSGAVLRRVVNNSGTSEVWRYYQTDISAFRGQSIRLRFSNSNYGGNYIHVDDAGIQGVAVPDWDVSGNTFGSNGSLFGVSGGSYDGSNLAYLNYCANCTLTSPVFEVSSEAQSISWRWKTRYNTESYVDIVDASSGAVLRRVVNNSGTSEVWRYYQTDISAFRGQSIRLRFSNSNYGGNYIHVDDVILTPFTSETFTITETNPLGYGSSTPDQASVDLYGGRITTVNFGDYSVDLGQSTLEVTPLSLLADGIETAQVTVTMRDALGEVMPGREVQVNVDGTDVVVEQGTTTTDENGQVTALFHSTVAQSVTVSARDLLEGAVLPDTEIVILQAGALDTSQSSFEIDPTSVTADNLATANVSVVLRDVFGNPIPGHQVELLHNGTNVTTDTSATSDQDGLVTGTVRSDTEQTVEIQVHDLTEDIYFPNTLSVDFLSTDANLSTITVVPTIVTADGSDIATITVTLRDPLGVVLPNKEVTLQVLEGSENFINGISVGNEAVSIGTTNAEGIATAELTSLRAEAKTLVATGDSVALEESVTATFEAGPVSPTTSTITADPAVVVADGVDSSQLTVTLLDENNNPVVGHEVALDTTGISVSVNAPEPPITDSSGKLVFAIRSEELGDVAINATDLTAGITLADDAQIMFVTGETDPALSTVEAVQSSLVANGVDTSTITVTLFDALGHPISGHAVALDVSGTGNIIVGPTPITTGNDGIVAFTLASTTAGTKTISIYDTTDGIILDTQLQIVFTPGIVDSSVSTISAQNSTAPADGNTDISITVTAKDQFGNPVPNVEVTLNTTGNAVVMQPENTTNELGQVTGYVSNTMTEIVVVSAIVGDVVLDNQMIITFEGVDLSVALEADPEIPAMGTITYKVSVSNSGSVLAENVLVSLDLASGITYLSNTSNYTLTQSGQIVALELGTIGPEASIEFLINGKVENTLDIGTPLSSHITVSSSHLEQELGNNTATAITHVVDGYAFETWVSPVTQTLGVGAHGIYKVTVKNTGLLPDTYSVAIDGLDPTLYNLSAPEIRLSSGERTDIVFDVQADTCAVMGAIPFSVQVTGLTEGEAQNFPAEVVFQSAPILSNLRPEMGVLLGSRDVTISWQTDVPASAVLKVYPVDKPENTQTYALDEATLHSIVVEGLARNTTYEWLVEATSSCGVVTSTPQQFAIGNGVVFDNHLQSLTVNRDYEQISQISVTNQDNKPQEILVEIQHDYEDLIVNFRGSGSIDETITLLPGETRSVELAIFAQDAMLKGQPYVLNAVLTGHDGVSTITDLAVINVNVLFEIDYSLEEVSLNPILNTTTYRIINNGQPITDLYVDAVDRETGLPASVYITPQIIHARLGTGEAIEFTVMPLYSSDDITSPSASILSSRGLAAPSNQVNLFDIETMVAGEIQRHRVEQSCDDGRNVYPVTLNNMMLPISFRSWYCPNRAEIDIQMCIPPFVQSGTLQGASLNLGIDPSQKPEAYNLDVSFNGHAVARVENQILEGDYTIPIDASQIKTGFGACTTNTIHLSADFPNFAHYQIWADGALQLALDNATVYVCAASQSEANALAEEAYGFVDLPDTASVSIRKPAADSAVEFDMNGGVNLQAYVSDDATTYTNIYSVEAEIEYLDVFLTPTEKVTLSDDGIPSHGDSRADDRYFNALWTPQHGGNIQMTVTATAPNGLVVSDEITFTIDAKPDFELTRVYIEEITRKGNAVEVLAEIKNNGFSVDGPLTVRFLYYNVDESGEKVGLPIFISNEEVFDTLFNQKFEHGEVITVKNEKFIPPEVNIYYVVVIVDPEQ